MTEPSGNAGVALPDMRTLFAGIRTIAVVGYSDNPERAGHFVPAYLSGQGYQIIAINPKFSGAVDGYPAYPSLASLPPDLRIDVVDIFRAPEAVPVLAEEAGALRPLPQYFWMQPGAENEGAARRAAELGMQPISGLCMLAEHKKLSP